jgi:hypothetical protein
MITDDVVTLMVVVLELGPLLPGLLLVTGGGLTLPNLLLVGPLPGALPEGARVGWLELGTAARLTELELDWTGSTTGRDEAEAAGRDEGTTDGNCGTDERLTGTELARAEKSEALNELTGREEEETLERAGFDVRELDWTPPFKELELTGMTGLDEAAREETIESAWRELEEMAAWDEARDETTRLAERELEGTTAPDEVAREETLGATTPEREEMLASDQARDETIGADEAGTDEMAGSDARTLDDATTTEELALARIETSETELELTGTITKLELAETITELELELTGTITELELTGAIELATIDDGTAELATEELADGMAEEAGQETIADGGFWKVVTSLGKTFEQSVKPWMF